MPFERRKQPLASAAKFRSRMLRHFICGSILIAFSLVLGTSGYCFFGKLPFVDGFYNASMILTGMGPVSPMNNNAGKLFASFYALYSGLAFLAAVSVTLAPLLHRFLHSLHLDDTD